jgi:ceramide glucosyltransferase
LERSSFSTHYSIAPTLLYSNIRLAAGLQFRLGTGVILNGFFGALAVLSLLLMLWQWLVASRFPLHRRASDNSFAPAVTLLKSLKGCDETTENCLRSWFAQNYAGPIQILFGVASADDPVCGIVKKLLKEFSALDAQLIICGPLPGANAKISKLAALEKLAKHDIVLISDADVRVPPDFLANVVAPLHDAYGRAGSPLPAEAARMDDGAHGATCPTNVGLVNCFYCLANPTTLAMRWEAVAINADFWSQVLQSQSLKPLDFALGAVMAVPRKQLEETGGLQSLADCLADDYQLGNRIARHGHRIVISPVVVECWSAPMSWAAVWKHQLRWARTIRVCQPAPYFFSILSNATLWPLLWLIVNPAKPALIFSVGCWLVRAIAAMNLEQRLTRSCAHFPFLWIAWIKDLLQLAIWFCAFTGNRIEWRGQRYRLQSNGTLVKI